MMGKINQEEYEVLKALDNKWEWIARDGDEGVWAYNSRPNKLEESWDAWTFTELNKDLFQFIKWEDEEPYSIAELIEEYEVDYLGSWEHAIEFSEEIRKESEETEAKEKERIKDTELLMEDFRCGRITSNKVREAIGLVNAESEETEVKKDLDSLVQRIHYEREQLAKSFAEGKETDDEIAFNDGKDEALSSILWFIDQMDEPETLSPDWIEDNQLVYPSAHGVDYYVPAGKLFGLIVPKQELPVIPQWVADNIESKKRVGTRLNVAMSDFPECRLERELDIDEHECNEIYARAWLDGYEVEKEQKYHVILNQSDDKDRGQALYKIYTMSSKKPSSHLIHSFEIREALEVGNFQFTEKEIKGYDERFWAFAVPVEEEE